MKNNTFSYLFIMNDKINNLIKNLKKSRKDIEELYEKSKNNEEFSKLLEKFALSLDDNKFSFLEKFRCYFKLLNFSKSIVTHSQDVGPTEFSVFESYQDLSDKTISLRYDLFDLAIQDLKSKYIAVIEEGFQTKQMLVASSDKIYFVDFNSWDEKQYGSLFYGFSYHQITNVTESIITSFKDYGDIDLKLDNYLLS